VERSVKFNFNEEVIMRLSPALEGDDSPVNSSENQTEAVEAPIIEGDKNLDIVDDAPIVDEDRNLNVVESPDQGREKRIRKETEYVRMLKDSWPTIINTQVNAAGLECGGGH
jgi:hypothetical protein